MSTIRPASTHADRLAVLEVSRAATRPDENATWFQALRLRVPRRHEAVWWLLEDEGRALSSLLCYPLRFALGGEVVEGYGLGAVATRPEARRRGHAAALCRRVVKDAEAQGRRVGLLYSAIPPAFYERLGFAVVPAWDHLCRDLPGMAASGERASLAPLDPRERAEALSRCYEACHPGLHLFRDARAWLGCLDRDPSDLFLGIGEPLRGYLRLHPQGDDVLEVVELVARPDERAAALRAAAALAADVGRTALEGWFEPEPALAAFLEDRGRARTLPMVRGGTHPEGARFWGSDYF